jgi:hypothetical protein
MQKPPCGGFSYLATKGIKAIILALLMAVVNSLWCLAQAPVLSLGLIFPDLETYLERVSVSWKFISWTFFLQK